MYCTKCGSQIADGAAFCTNCGCKVDYQPDANEGANSGASDTTNSTYKSAKPVDKNVWDSIKKAKYEFLIKFKILNEDEIDIDKETDPSTGYVILSILGVLSIWLSWTLFKKMLYYIAGAADEGESTADILALVSWRIFVLAVIGCIVSAAVFYSRDLIRLLKKIKANNLVFDSIERVFEKIQATQCSFIRELRLDGMGNIIIRGQFSEYHLYLKDKEIFFENTKHSLRKNMYSFAEQICIYELLYANKQFKEGSMEYVAYNFKIKCAKIFGKLKITTIIAIALCIVFTLYSILVGDYVSMVKDSYFDDDSKVTYEEAFDSYFKNTSWRHFTSTDGDEVVEFTGSMSNPYRPVKFQWIVYEDKGYFELAYVEIDGEGTSQLEMSLLLNAMKSNL